MMHTTRNLGRRTIVLLALALSLALPASTFAASQSGDTPETLTVASTISATFPAAQTYHITDSNSTEFTNPAGSLYETGDAFVTIIGSNNPTGVSISVSVDPWVGAGSITVPTSQRLTSVSGDAAGSGAALTPTSPVIKPAGTFASSSTVVTLATSTGPLAGRKVGVDYGVAVSQFTVGGDYTSAAHYTASTNP